MSRLELCLWGLDFVIGGIGYFVGGPYPGLLCFFVAGILIFVGLTKKDESENKGSPVPLLVDQTNQPYRSTSRTKTWHKRGLAGFILVSVILISYGVIKHQLRRTAILHKAKPTITMTTWGSEPNGKVFAIIKIESPPPIDAPFRLLLICRVVDSTIDEMEDTRIEKSSLRSLTGQTIEMTVSQDFLMRAYQLKLVHVILVILPSGVEPNKILKLSDIPPLGGQIAIIDGFVPTVYPTKQKGKKISEKPVI